MTWRNRTNGDRLNPEELWQRLQNALWDLPAKLPEKLCASAPRAKTALNAKDGHTKCWLHLVKFIDKENLFMTLFLTASSFCSIFTQVSKTFNSTVALQVGLLKHLGDVATVPLVLVSVCCVSSCHSRQTGWWSDQISVWSTGCCQTPCANKNLTGLLQLMAKWVFGNVNWYFLLTHTAKDRNNWLLNHFLAGENSSALRPLHSTVHIYNIIYTFCNDEGWTTGQQLNLSVELY